MKVALLVLVYPLAFLVPPRAPARAASLAAGAAAGTPLAAWDSVLSQYAVPSHALRVHESGLERVSDHWNLELRTVFRFS